MNNFKCIENAQNYFIKTVFYHDKSVSYSFCKVLRSGFI